MHQVEHNCNCEYCTRNNDTKTKWSVVVPENWAKVKITKKSLLERIDLLEDQLNRIELKIACVDEESGTDNATLLRFIKKLEQRIDEHLRNV